MNYLQTVLLMYIVTSMKKSSERSAEAEYVKCWNMHYTYMLQ